MAIKRIYAGNLGPQDYDDTELINDRDGEFPGVYRHGFSTAGQIYVGQAPTLDNEIARFVDLLTNITEVFTSTGTIAKNSQVVLASGTFNLFLPTLANGDKRIYEVKNYGSGIITLKPNATEAAKTIDGETAQAIRSLDALTVYGNNTNNSWWII